MSISQLILVTLHYICKSRVRTSNFSFTHLRDKILDTRLLDKKKLWRYEKYLVGRNPKKKYFDIHIKIFISFVSVNISRFVGTLLNKCRDRSSNPRYSIYSHLRGESITLNYLTQKKIFII